MYSGVILLWWCYLQEKNIQTFGYPLLISFVTITIAVIFLDYAGDFLLIYVGAILLWWCYVQEKNNQQEYSTRIISCVTITIAVVLLAYGDFLLDYVEDFLMDY